MSKFPRKPGLRAASAATGLALLAAACGSTSTSSASAAKISSSAAPAAVTSAVSAAQSLVQQLEQRPTTLDIPALPSAPPTGKTVDYVACGLPVCVAFGASVQQALAAIGWHYKFINAGLTPQTVAAAYDQAVADHPAGVIGSGGFSPSLFSHQLQELAAEKVAVVLSASSGAPNVTGTLAGPAFLAQDGQEMADFALADSHGHGAHMAIITTPATPIYTTAHQAIEQTLSTKCSDCSVVTYSFPETDIGTQLPTEVVSFLRTHPDVNYLFFDFSNEVDGVPSALASAGLAGKVKILTTDTTSTESGYLQQGQEAAAAAVPWDELFWGGVNIVVRYTMGLPLGPALDIQYPHMIFTGSNLPTTNGIIPLVANYQSLFKAAWHVS